MERQIVCGNGLDMYDALVKAREDFNIIIIATRADDKRILDLIAVKARTAINALDTAINNVEVQGN